MKSGYLYAVCGEKYIKEAIKSAKSLRKVQPECSIAIISDKPCSPDSVFDHHVYARTSGPEERSFFYKVKHIYKNTLYEKTFFVDSDTWFYGRTDHLFDLLEYFDICASFESNDHTPVIVSGKCLKGYLPVYNTGVILFKKNAGNDVFFEAYEKEYEDMLNHWSSKAGFPNDQQAFMRAYIRSKSRILALKNNYNARICEFINLVGDVKIAHGRAKNYDALWVSLHPTMQDRSWDPFRRQCSYYKRSLRSKLVYAFWSRLNDFRSLRSLRNVR